MVLLLMCLYCLPLLAASLVSQEIIPLSSPVYTAMDNLYALTGAGTPSNSRPWSKTEAYLILSRVERAALADSTTLRRLYASITDELDKGLRFQFADGFQFGVDVTLNTEGYHHTNGSDFKLDTDWVYGFEERKPSIMLALDFALMDFLYIYCDLQYGRNLYNAADTYGLTPQIGAIINAGEANYTTWSSIYSQTFLTNFVPFNESYDFDFQWPKRAVASVGGDHWNFTLSRDKLNWGNGHSGNFIVDDHVDYQEYARAQVFSDYFKYDWLNVFFDTNPSGGEIPDSEFRVLMAHRLEFRILQRITLAISENVMYQNDVFDLRYINPAFIYHNLNNRSMFNAIAHIELDVAFAQGFNAYGQYVLDQARAPNESAAQADATGFLLGVEYAAVLEPALFSTSLEFAQTSPALYRRDGVDFLMFRKYFTNGASSGPGYLLKVDYIGYPLGGDAQVLQWDATLDFPGKGSVCVQVQGTRQGEIDFLTAWEVVNATREAAPSGDHIDETLVIGVSGEYILPQVVSWIAGSLWAQANWIGRRIHTESTGTYASYTQDLQLSFGVSVRY
ncbi:MAG: hypothetical protein AB9828_02155 [Sphaerochaetaceae bacterium]